MAALVCGPVRFGRVFDDLDAVLARQFHQRVHVHGMAVDVDGDDGFGARRELGRDLLHVHLPVVGFVIDQDGRRTAVGDGVDGGDHGEGGQDDFVARLQPQGGERQVHGDGAVGAGDAIAGVARLGKPGLEVADEAARRRNPVGFNGLLDVL